MELLEVAGVTGFFLRDLRLAYGARGLGQACVADEITHGKALVWPSW